MVWDPPPPHRSGAELLKGPLAVGEGQRGAGGGLCSGTKRLSCPVQTMDCRETRRATPPLTFRFLLRHEPEGEDGEEGRTVKGQHVGGRTRRDPLG